MPANRRLLDVNAYTTFDFLDAAAVGHDWTDESVAVLNVETPRDAPDEVRLAVELDATDLDELPGHADRVALSPDQARTLAAELKSKADDAEAAEGGADEAEVSER